VKIPGDGTISLETCRSERIGCKYAQVEPVLTQAGTSRYALSI
jgi:hypothetical protein